MARFIRRRSMERLELYDLDQYTQNQRECPPPLPPPRNPLLQRRTSMNPTVERYQFLCNMTRNRTDPIYAATPMFTTIPHSSYQDSHRHILGSYIRSENVKPISSEIPVQSPEPEKKQTVKQQIDEKENESEEKQDIYVNHPDTESDNDGDDEEFSGSSSSDDDGDNQKKKKDDDKDDDDQTQGIVEKIFNRDKTN